jgi:quercetin dioxygenase-like cupin family protein
MSNWITGACLIVGATSTLLTADAQQSSSAERGFIIVRPEEIRWQASASLPGLQTAAISGDPSKPGLYVLRVKFPPGVMTQPHVHNEDRLVAVVQGTWWVGTGAVFDPDKTVPLKAGSFMKHPAGAEHYDGAKDEEVIVQIIGMGAASTTFVKPELGAVGSSRPAGREPAR